jgi:hypothetical protein
MNNLFSHERGDNALGAYSECDKAVFKTMRRSMCFANAVVV